MRPILTPTESAELDRVSAERGVKAESLMENAGRTTAAAVVDVMGGSYGRRAVVVCGKGNNGGDGLVAARHLSRAGTRVVVVMLEDPAALSGLPALNYGRLAEEPGIRVRGAGPLAGELARADAAVDAIFGTGFRGAPEGVHEEAIEILNSSGVPVVAADIPSGVDGATGSVEGSAVRAVVTVTFGAAKPGVILYPGAGYAGLVRVEDIGFPADLVSSKLQLVEAEDVALMLPVRAADTHKRAAGAVLVVGGSREMTGAVCLTAHAAYRAGAGLVTLAVPRGILPVVESSIVETTFLGLPETADGGVAPEALEGLRGLLGSFGAIALGPGMSRDEGAAEFIRGLVAAAPAGLVLDADGLNAFADRLEDLEGQCRGIADLVLTPHTGEFARLTGSTAEDVASDRVEAARALASRVRATVLLKGTRTVVAAQDGETRINPTGSSTLATGGTGDVLSGAIAALMARGLDSFDAATAGAFLHGLAGLIAGAELGEGTTAGDVADRLPEASAEVHP